MVDANQSEEEIIVKFDAAIVNALKGFDLKSQRADTWWTRLIWFIQKMPLLFYESTDLIKTSDYKSVDLEITKSVYDTIFTKMRMIMRKKLIFISNDA